MKRESAEDFAAAATSITNHFNNVYNEK